MNGSTVSVAAISGLSRATVKQLISDGGVRLDGKTISRASAKVDAGSRLEVAVPPTVESVPEADPAVEFDVVHRDDDVIVVDKPAGLVVHPGAGHAAGTMINGLLARFPEIAEVGERHRPGIVHRLDRGTSGLLVVARNEGAYRSLVEQLSAREPKRTYRALAWGNIETEAGTIEAPIGRSTRHPTRMTVTPQGKPAVTRYTVVARYSEPAPTSLLSCELETGRTHQIRVHLRAIGHPVVGDREYDGGRPGIDPGRPFLHAAALRFRHPRTGEELEFQSDLPAELKAVLADLR